MRVLYIEWECFTRVSVVKRIALDLRVLNLGTMNQSAGGFIGAQAETSVQHQINSSGIGHVCMLSRKPPSKVKLVAKKRQHGNPGSTRD